MTRRWALAVGAAGLALLAPAAAAQQACTPQEREHAAALEAAGNADRTSSQDAAALRRFEAAYGLCRHPRALARIALAEAALERWACAAEHLQAALDVAGDAWIEENRAGLLEDLRHIRERQPPGGRCTAAPLARPEGTAPPRPPPAPQADGPGGLQRVLGGVSAGLAVVGLGVGAVGWGLREQRAGDFNANTRCDGVVAQAAYDACAAERDAVFDMEAVQIVGFVAAGVFGAAAAVLFVTAPSRGREAPTAVSWRCGVGPGAVGLECGVPF